MGWRRTKLRGLEEYFTINIDHTCGSDFASMNWIGRRQARQAVGELVYRMERLRSPR